jgi:predicted PurR-regulated permease PerM
MTDHSKADFPQWSYRQIIMGTIFVVAVGIGFGLLYQFRILLIILFIAIVLGTAIRPGVQWLYERGLPRSMGVIIVYLAGLIGIITILFLVLPLFSRQATRLAIDMPQYYLSVREGMIQSPSRLLRILGFQLPPQVFTVLNQQPAEGEALDRVTQSLEVAGLLARSILTTLAVFLLGFYWTLESERIIRGVLLLLPSERRTYVRELINEVETKLGKFIRGQSLLLLAIGVMSLIAYLIIGLPYALVLAIIAGLLEAVPLVGPALGAIPAALVALTVDPIKVFWVAIATVIIQASENYLLVPRVMGRSVGVSPFVILLSLAAFASLLGIPGALLAIPLAGIIQILLDHLIFKLEPPEANTPPGRDFASMLRLEAQDLTNDIRMQLRIKESPSEEENDKIEDAIESIAIELDKFLESVGQWERVE